MAVNVECYKNIVAEPNSKKVTLVAVSKTKSANEILALYDMGQRDFGENYVQELVEKYDQLPKDIRWHFIGHLQSNKVKLIAPFVYLIHSVDSEKLLKEINKQGEKNNRKIDCLLQVHIAEEETKFGFDEKELDTFFKETSSRNDPGFYKNIRIVGLMGMASFTDDRNLVRNEFQFLKSLFTKNSTFSLLNSQFSILSMGMSSDYELAIEEGSNMIRIGSLLFGKRELKK
jgi:hypothetical protein